MAKSKAAGKTSKNGEGLQEIQQKADGYLEEIVLRKGELEALQKEYDEALKALTDQYALQIEAYQALLDGAIKALIQTMKYNKKVLFASADVVNLLHGSLIRNAGEKVTIPHGALQSCKDNGFQDVIKIAESLDREAIEKWPDDKLAMIGAKKKPSEEFKYDLRKS